MGSFVTVSKDYQTYGDAADGPLSPGKFGEVVEKDSSDVPYKVSYIELHLI